MDRREISNSENWKCYIKQAERNKKRKEKNTSEG